MQPRPEQDDKEVVEITEAEYDITPEQKQAIAHRLEGKSYRDIADMLGKSPTTINDWFNHNPEVVAAFEKRTGEVYQEAEDRMRILTSKGIDCLFDAVKYAKKEAETEIDYRPLLDVAVQIMKVTGFHGDTMKDIIESLQEGEDEVSSAVKKLERALEGMNDSKKDAIVDELVQTIDEMK